jgi:AAA+ ATPase superfamily predicted ATPase
MFIGRKEELKILNELYSDPDGKLVAIYGRRRIGKSELINHFLEDKKHLYVDGQEGEHTPNQIKTFIGQIAKQTGNTYLVDTKFTDWVSVFN